MRGRFPGKKPAHFGKSKINFLLACLFMIAHILSSNGPTEPKGTKLPESSIPGSSFLPDPWWNKDPSNVWFSPSAGAQIQSWTNRRFLDRGAAIPKRLLHEPENERVYKVNRTILSKIPCTEEWLIAHTHKKKKFKLGQIKRSWLNSPLLAVAGMTAANKTYKTLDKEARRLSACLSACHLI